MDRKDSTLHIHLQTPQHFRSPLHDQIVCMFEPGTLNGRGFTGGTFKRTHEFHPQAHLLSISSYPISSKLSRDCDSEKGPELAVISIIMSLYCTSWLK